MRLLKDLTAFHSTWLRKSCISSSWFLLERRWRHLVVAPLHLQNSPQHSPRFSPTQTQMRTSCVKNQWRHGICQDHTVYQKIYRSAPCAIWRCSFQRGVGWAAAISFPPSEKISTKSEMFKNCKWFSCFDRYTYNFWSQLFLQSRSPLLSSLHEWRQVTSTRRKVSFL